MQLRKIIFVWTMLALVFAQFAIAQHNAAHLDHGFESISIHQMAVDHDSGDKKSSPKHRSHNCPECLLAKTLQTAFSIDGGLSVDFIFVRSTAIPVELTFVSKVVSSSYNPRAPPVRLI